MLSRRDLVQKLAAGTAAVCAVGVAKAGLASTQPVADASTGTTPEQSQLASIQQEVGPLPGQMLPGPQVVDQGVQATAAAPAPWELLHPLAMGSTVAHGWQVAGLTGAVDGSCVLTLKNERGRSHRVHLCRNNGQPSGIVYTSEFDLVVMNGGEGDLPTEEGFAQAVAEVAHVLASNESDRRRSAMLASLMPHEERVQKFSDRRLR